MFKDHKFFLWDTLTIEQNELKLYVSNELVQLPKSVTISLKHKIKTKSLIRGDDIDIQFMIKQGSTWYNLTNIGHWNRSASKGCPYTWFKKHESAAKAKAASPIAV